MATNIREKTVSGMFWTMVERTSNLACQFVISIWLARLLSPEEFGVVGLILVFMAVAQTLLDGGFANALIQKKNRNDIDYSTAFYFNIIVSILLYAILYVSAPCISDFYDLPILTPVTRVYSISIIINALSIVQTTKLSIELNFRLQAVVTALSVFLSGVLAILCAYLGYGVWAMVIHGVSCAFFRTLLLCTFSRWLPLLVFSRESFCRMFAFGSKLLVGNLLHTLYTNLYTIVIGKTFSPADVGFFNSANRYTSLPYGIHGQVVNKVIFPILSGYQDDDSRLVYVYGKLLKASMFFYIPLMFGIVVLARPLVTIVLGDVWLPTVPIMQVLGLGLVFAPLSTVNLNLLWVKGRSDISLRLDIVKKVMGVVILFATIPFGLFWMCVGKAFYDLFAFAANSYFTYILLDYGIIRQLRDILPTLAYSMVMSCFIYIISLYVIDDLLLILLGVVVGVLVFTFIAFLCRDATLGDIVCIIKNKKI